MGKKRKVTVITGFLGSGKTTLLTHLLKGPSLKNTAVLVNEFGKVGLDHHLLRRIDERTLLLGGGCLCCSVREDLVNALRELLDNDHRGDIEPLERIVIETSGLADPAPILFTVLTDSVLQHHLTVDQVIVTVDAVNGQFHLDRQNESVKQVAAADKIIITKTDMASENEVELLASRLLTINPSAEIIKSIHGNIDNHQLFAPNEKVKSTPLISLVESNSFQGKHAPAARSISLTFDQPLDWSAFGLWLSMLLHARGEEILRVKGMIDVGEDGPVMLNGVQHIIHPPEHLDEWSDEDKRSHIVFIMRSIDPEQILSSLHAFQNILGSRASIREPVEVL
ncbi:CobW family GTP-binding protein [Domibacillus epiphyticus]|uniref:Cobalamin biosynthesis protein CobW n=1 Tax=Domibacillus epiphyticus TaxID=1714355 RepID=A0A1V2ACS6_9BACI|nr:GTP-binding protein [Domibacillus epiphyticus]OMP68760.1 cobalamin biosynthesis protein CobW [Domibacillus epiphyticus]